MLQHKTPTSRSIEDKSVPSQFKRILSLSLLRMAVCLEEKAVQTVNNSWPKYDKRTGFMLCEGCWNNQNWRHGCAGFMCECPKCTGMKPPQPAKFTGEGQTTISMEGALEIGPKP